MVHQKQGCPEAMPTRLSTTDKEKQWGVWLRAVTARWSISSNQWSGGGYSHYDREAAEDNPREDFQSNFRCSENKEKSKKHDASNAASGSDDSLFYLRGGEKIGSNSAVHNMAHVKGELAVQENAKRSEDAPRQKMLQLCDEVEDQDCPLTRVGPSSGQKGGLKMMNVEQPLEEFQSIFGHHTMCMETAVSGYAEKGVTVPRSAPLNLCDKVDDIDSPLKHRGPDSGEKGG